MKTLAVTEAKTNVEPQIKTKDEPNFAATSSEKLETVMCFPRCTIINE